MATLYDYEVVIGLEVHVQLLTESKIFAGDPNQFSTESNTNISVITLAHPGTLPKLNKKVVEHAIKMGLACGCHINRETIFARKNYFYPDLPKGYQISQDKAPICEGGEVKFTLKMKGQDDKEAVMPLTRIHLEEDAGKSSHPFGEEFSQVDYNRAGTPLIEIVTDPVVCHPDEAGAFAYGYFQEIRRLVDYLEICDGKMEQGSLRCDANVSIMPKGSKVFGQRTEIKNLNSVRNVQRAINLEIERQFNLTQAGEKILRQTLNFDAQSGKITAMRTKEEMNDYRYFPDPDLAPIIISDEWLNSIKNQMPALPSEIKHLLTTTYGLNTYDAEVLTEEKAVYQFFTQATQHTTHYKLVANWLMGEIKSYLNQQSIGIESLTITPINLAALIEMVAGGKLSHTIAAQQLFPLMLQNPKQSAEELAQANQLLSNQNEDDLSGIIKEIIAAFPKEAKAYQQGKKKLKGMFMGQIMKKTQGKADPKLTNQLLEKLIREV